MRSMRPLWTTHHPTVMVDRDRMLGLGARAPAGPAHTCARAGPAHMLGHVLLRACIHRARLHHHRPPPPCGACHLLQVFFRMYLCRLNFIWTILGLIGLHSSSSTSLWAQYGSNLEASNINNLYLNSIFYLYLSLRACDPSHPYALGMPTILWMDKCGS